MGAAGEGFLVDAVVTVPLSTILLIMGATGERLGIFGCREMWDESMVSERTIVFWTKSDCEVVSGCGTKTGTVP